MHVGKHVPRSYRPDLYLFNDSRGYLPRRFKKWQQYAEGTMISAQAGTYAISSLLEESTDGQQFFYTWEPPAFPLSKWEFRFWYVDPVAIPSAHSMIGRAKWSYWHDGTLAAYQECDAHPFFGEWWRPFSSYTQQNCSVSSWTRLVSTAQFGNAQMLYGSTTWAENPDYKPYVTRPE